MKRGEEATYRDKPLVAGKARANKPHEFGTRRRKVKGLEGSTRRGEAPKRLVETREHTEETNQLKQEVGETNGSEDDEERFLRCCKGGKPTCAAWKRNDDARGCREN